ncbi:phosphohistidine phosphatase [Alteromonadaceae bacterium Bs31]|nr:phosphohistidine phosphatase [Alteromonadaceae bacterium Bs31]
MLICSPLIRAQQSAEVVQAVVPAARKITADWIKPSSMPQTAIDELYKLFSQDVETVMVVSHLPFVAHLIERLCGLEQGFIRMGTGSLVALDLPVIAAGCGTLLWQQHPEVLCDPV